LEAFVVDALPLKLLGGGVGGRAFRFVGDVVVVVTTIPSSLSVLLLLLAIVEASYSGNGSAFLVLLLSLPSEAGEACCNHCSKLLTLPVGESLLLELFVDESGEGSDRRKVEFPGVDAGVCLPLVVASSANRTVESALVRWGKNMASLSLFRSPQLRCSWSSS